MRLSQLAPKLLAQRAGQHKKDKRQWYWKLTLRLQRAKPQKKGKGLRTWTHKLTTTSSSSLRAGHRNKKKRLGTCTHKLRSQ
eukprot:4805269-Prorocentrum_lima.AAC.1